MSLIKPPSDLFLNLLDRHTRELVEVGEYADKLKAAGLMCEQSHDPLTQLQINDLYSHKFLKGNYHGRRFKSTGEGFSRTTPGFTEELGAVLRASMEGKSGYSKQDAVADTQGLMRQQATNALQESMPKIAGMQNSAGAYGSTTKALLQNDLQARIMGQLAATQSQAIKDYAAIDADRIRAAAAATQASTASYSETFQNASSRKGWGSLFEPGGIGSAIVGGGLDAVSGGTKELKIMKAMQMVDKSLKPTIHSKSF